MSMTTDGTGPNPEKEVRKVEAEVKAEVEKTAEELSAEARAAHDKMIEEARKYLAFPETR